ncbi:MAG: Uma2 family endonuclease [Acidobacteriaceae bacterium]|nr:Uma2 family endonuclease [Acidobacteriaceae bacterium]MBV8569542.1 Uma2 family endonuclease [Acidobacteriaceae bacterium]
MVATAERLSFAEFKALYGRNEESYEYWNGRAVPKSMPKWIHGALQIILGQLLIQAGYKPAAEVELRIHPDYHPKPDVIATKRKINEEYPTSGLEVVIEILSEEDAMEYVLDKCEHYLAWGCEGIYVVDPSAKRIYHWNQRGLEIVSELAGIPGERIWAMLDEQL